MKAGGVCEVHFAEASVPLRCGQYYYYLPHSHCFVLLHHFVHPHLPPLCFAAQIAVYAARISIPVAVVVVVVVVAVVVVVVVVVVVIVAVSVAVVGIAVDALYCSALRALLLRLLKNQ